MSSTPSDALDGAEPRPAGKGRRAGSRRAANDQKPMRTFIGEQNIDFLGRPRFAYIASGVMLGVAILAIAIRGLAFGVDFTGGYTIELGYAEAPDVNEIRQTLESADLPAAQVQTFGTSTDILIRMAPREEGAGDEAAADAAPGAAGASVADEVVAALRAVSDSDVEIRRQEFVGPQVGEELREVGGLAMLTALAGILLYVWMRFEKKLAIGSVLALVHDVTIVVGFFALFGIEFDLTILAAVLAVIGYSLNDTVVVFDRIRENFRTMRRGTSREIMNAAINQTLTRTIITSGTTILVLLSLFFLGGQIIHGFSLALLVGIAVGTYSSIFVASLAALLLGTEREDLMPVEKEGRGSSTRTP